MADDKIALYFTPTNPGDHLIGLPARDLTEAEVEEYRRREPVLMRSATTPHPSTGKTLYSENKPRGKQADVIDANKETVSAGPSAVVTETPKE